MRFAKYFRYAFVLALIWFSVGIIVRWVYPWLAGKGKNTSVEISLDEVRTSDKDWKTWSKDSQELIDKFKRSCNGFQGEALSKAQEFCSTFDIPCGDKTSLESWHFHPTLPEVVMAPTALFDWDNIHLSDGTVAVFFDKNTSANGKDQIQMGVGCDSREVFLFDNSWIRWTYRKKYGIDRNYGPDKNLLSDWPAFMPESKAMKIISSLAKKLVMPRDMVFDKLEKRQKDGVWSGWWVRKKDGYPYEDDWMVISIMGSTGEFVGYQKRYEMKPCSTEVHVKKEDVLERGWNLLRSKLAPDLQGKMKDIYRADAELKIIQADRFGSTLSPFKSLKKEMSKLAWVARYVFTGGIDPNLGENGPSPMLLRYSMGDPPEAFEVRVNAATGETIYVTGVRKHVRKHVDRSLRTMIRKTIFFWQ